MGSYGRNFDFRVFPHGGQRGARYLLNPAADIPIGAPVEYDGGVSTSAFGHGVLGVSLATGAQPPNQPGLCGIAVYEHAPAAFAGYDPLLTNYSDLSTCPAGKLVQVINGTETKVVLTTTVASTFLYTRAYTGRVMVAGLGGSTSGDAEVGSNLTPGNGTDTAGYWQTTATAANAWLAVTAVNQDNLEVEARMTF
jgi:hypothetical protein